MENAIEAGASRIEVVVDEDLAADRLVIEVSDNGRGISKAMVERVLDPFFTTRKTRHGELGLPLFAAAAERCDGRLTVESEVGKGTRVRATFRHSHIDRAPLGDMPSALMAILLSGRPVDLAYVHRLGDAEFRFDSAEVRRELGDVPLTHPAVRRWLGQMLREGEESLRADPMEQESTDRRKRQTAKRGGGRMPKIKSLEELKKIREEAQKDLRIRTETGTRIIIGMGTCGIAAGARDVMHAVLKELERRDIEAHVETVGCIGMCAKEPLVDIEQAGKPRVTYANVTPEMVPRLIEAHLVHGRVVQEWALGRLDSKGIQ